MMHPLVPTRHHYMWPWEIQRVHGHFLYSCFGFLHLTGR
jgi:hypothetical protein